MKRTLALFLSALMLLALLAGCGSKAAPADQPDTAGTVQPGVTESDAAGQVQVGTDDTDGAQGSVNGGVYTNEFAGIGCRLDEGWVFYTAEQMAELNGALELGDQLNRLGVLVSVGHSNAVYAQVKEAAEHGFRHVTHLYSAMSTITRKNGFRYAGVLESTFCLPQLTAEIIADGCHLPPELIRMVYTLLGVERVCFCCDSMRCAGEQVTRSFLGNPQSGIPVIIEDGVAKLCDRSAFAGSVATDDRLVRTAVEQAEIPLTDAVRMMSLTPAQIMRVDARKGSIAPGKNADFVVLDETLRVSSVYAGARMVWEN